MIILSSIVSALSQENKHPDLKAFSNIQFDRTDNPNTDIENISWFSCSYTLNLTVNTYNNNKKKNTEKINHYLLMKKAVKLNHMSTPLQLDF